MLLVVFASFPLTPCCVSQWHPDGRRVVTAQASGKFALWYGCTFNFETINLAHDNAFRAMGWSHDGQWLITVGEFQVPLRLRSAFTYPFCFYRATTTAVSSTGSAISTTSRALSFTASPFAVSGVLPRAAARPPSLFFLSYHHLFPQLLAHRPQILHRLG